MSWSSYETYVESGSERVGVVPSEWGVTKLKYVAEAIPGGTPDTDRADFWDADEAGIPWIAIGDMSQRDAVSESSKSLSPLGLESKSLRVGRPGTVLFAMYASVGEVAVLNIAGAWNQAILGLVPDERECLERFLFYSMRTVKLYLPFLYRSNTQNNLNAEQVGNLEIALPPLPEQRLIADFLDRETAKIDSLIAKQQHLITTLREDRGATITEAVTSGLDPKVEMKDSGVDWIGHLPVHWDVVPIKRLATAITDGAHVSPQTEGGVYDFVSTKDVGDRGIDFEGALKTSPESYEYLVRNGCRPDPGDVLFSKDGTVGRTAVITERREFVVASSLIIIKPDTQRANSQFVHFLSQAVNVSQQVDSFVKGAGLPRLSISNLRKIVIALPPLQEQVAIVGVLSQRVTKIDALIERSVMMIDSLAEYRSALITDAVTGKIDVRGVA